MGEKEYRVLEDRLYGYLPDGTELRHIECYGNSNWDKPTTAPNGANICCGSLAVETNNGKAFFYDEEEGWVPANGEDEEGS